MTWKFHVICTIVTQLSVCTEPESIVRKYVKTLSRSMPKLQAHNDLHLFPHVIVAKIKCSYHFSQVWDLGETSKWIFLNIQPVWLWKLVSLGVYTLTLSKRCICGIWMKSCNFYGNMKVLSQWIAGTPYLPSNLIQENLQLSLVWMYTFTCVSTCVKVKSVYVYMRAHRQDRKRNEESQIKEKVLDENFSRSLFRI